MAATVTQKIAPKNFGFYTVNEITLDNSYLEGGEVVTAEQLGLQSVDFTLCDLIAGSESEEWAVVPYYTTESGGTTGKIHLISAKTGKELVKEKDMSKVVIRIVAFGQQRAK